MHMANHLVSPEVGSAMFLVSSVGIGYAVSKVKKANVVLERSDVGIFAATSALVFAGQMINYTIPLTGSSGHIVGAVLLALLFGQAPSLLAMSVILTLQSLLFADGGLFALGANIFNMAVIPCLIVVPLLQKIMTHRHGLLPVLATIMSLQLGAFSLVLETQFSHITALPFAEFLARMQSIHLAISLVEAGMTGGVLFCITKLCSRQATYLVSGLAFALGTVVSLLASKLPDGLEWASEKTSTGLSLTPTENLIQAVDKFQKSIALLPDYGLTVAPTNAVLGTMLSGMIGCSLTLLVVASFGLLLVKKTSFHRFQA